MTSSKYYLIDRKKSDLKYSVNANKKIVWFLLSLIGLCLIWIVYSLFYVKTDFIDTHSSNHDNNEQLLPINNKFVRLLNNIKTQDANSITPESDEKIIDNQNVARIENNDLNTNVHHRSENNLNNNIIYGTEIDDFNNTQNQRLLTNRHNISDLTDSEKHGDDALSILNGDQNQLNDNGNNEKHIDDVTGTLSEDKNQLNDNSNNEKHIDDVTRTLNEDKNQLNDNSNNEKHIDDVTETLNEVKNQLNENSNIEKHIDDVTGTYHTHKNIIAHDSDIVEKILNSELNFDRIKHFETIIRNTSKESTNNNIGNHNEPVSDNDDDLKLTEGMSENELNELHKIRKKIKNNVDGEFHNVSAKVGNGDDDVNYGVCSTNISDVNKFDCFPRGSPNEESCTQRGCCWKVSSNYKVPACYYPIGFETYKIVSVVNATYGFNVVWKKKIQSPYGQDIEMLNMNVKFETKERVHIKITDANASRYEPVIPEVPSFAGHISWSVESLYEVSVSENQTGFAVIRKSDQSIIFDSRSIGGFIYSNQFLQISALLSSKYIYGLGEHRNNFLLDTNWATISLWPLDGSPTDNVNGYGVHPFLLNLNNQTGNAHGVYLKSSNAMDIILQPTPAITYRVIGGILDFYFFLGPSPADVVSQYLEIIGNPDLPPYWSLGYHLCRWGYKNVSHLQSIINRNLIQRIPLDTVWVDIDYMERRNNFKVDSSFEQLKEYVQELHKGGLHFVPIIDPGIASREGPDYLPYVEGINKKIFVKDALGHPVEGKVWNDKGGTVFPDFSNPDTAEYWLNQFQRLYAQFEFDGAWIDMNEPSNFVNGSLMGCPRNSSLENPPYTPRVHGGVLNFKTLCMESRHDGGYHYNLHSLYGTMETIATSFALKEIRNKRSFVISRSTYSGQGKFGGHWTGDVFSTYDDMKHTVSDILSFNLFGIPMVGADICGFVGNTNPELCQRWHQVGAFYPFSRNHNENNAIPQDPAVFDQEIIDSIKTVYAIRYTLLPYLYSLFYRAHLYGETVARPLLFEFPTDVNTYSINTQFLWGSGLLISPVLEKDHTSKQTYLPKGYWYDYYNSGQIKSSGKTYIIEAPKDRIPLFIRGGTILPAQIPDVSTTLSRQNPMYLIVALDESGTASGFFYWDDGDSLNTWENNQVSLVKYTVTKHMLESTVELSGYINPEANVQITHVQILGVDTNVTKVKVIQGSTKSHVKFNQTNLRLDVVNLKLDIIKRFSISWT